MDLVALRGGKAIFDQSFGHVDPGTETYFAFLLVEVDLADLQFGFVNSSDFGLRGARFYFHLLLAEDASGEAKKGDEERTEHFERWND